MSWASYHYRILVQQLKQDVIHANTSTLMPQPIILETSASQSDIVLLQREGDIKMPIAHVLKTNQATVPKSRKTYSRHR